MFTLICARINDWVNNREAGDLRRHLDHYDVSVMMYGHWIQMSYYCCFILSLGTNLGLTPVGISWLEKVWSRGRLMWSKGVRYWTQQMWGIGQITQLYGHWVGWKVCQDLKEGVGSCLREMRRTECCHFLPPGVRQWYSAERACAQWASTRHHCIGEFCLWCLQLYGF